LQIKTQIIKLNETHLNIIMQIFSQQFKAEAWSKQQILDSINSKSTIFYGLFVDNILTSVASVLITVDDINLLQIATEQHFKRKGYAKKLLSFLLTLKNNDQTFSLEVKSKNTPAIALYSGFGFKTLNIRKNYYKDGDDALCMFLNKG